MTIQDQVIGYFNRMPVNGYRTATEINKGINNGKLGSVSSTINRMCKNGILESVKEYGARGGHGYRLSTEFVIQNGSRLDIKRRIGK